MVKKTVYIFGAGASASVGLPVQAAIIQQIFSIDISEIDSVVKGSFLDSSEESILIAGAYSDFCQFRKHVASFLIGLFGNANDKKQLNATISTEELRTPDSLEARMAWRELFDQVKKYQIALEDIFTIFDKSFIANEYFREYSDIELHNFSEALYKCIIFVISFYSVKGQNHSFLKEFSQHLINKRLNPKSEISNISIISLNWDTILDFSLFNASILRRTPRSKKFVEIDYCSNEVNLDKATSGLKVNIRGDIKLKFMKLHGSINWLMCSNCGRFFTHHEMNIVIRNLYEANSVSKEICEKCNEHLIKYELNPIIITPTFLKSLNSVHVKNIWQSAYLELSDATDIYFIGYSFPEADFEFRYLLKKAISHSAKIRIVLHQNDNPEFINAKIKKLSKKNKNIIEKKINTPEQRYRSFFAGNQVEFSYLGFEESFKTNFII